MLTNVWLLFAKENHDVGHLMAQVDDDQDQKCLWKKKDDIKSWSLVGLVVRQNDDDNEMVFQVEVH